MRKRPFCLAMLMIFVLKVASAQKPVFSGIALGSTIDQLRAQLGSGYQWAHQPVAQISSVDFYFAADGVHTDTFTLVDGKLVAYYLDAIFPKGSQPLISSIQQSVRTKMGTQYLGRPDNWLMDNNGKFVTNTVSQGRYSVPNDCYADIEESSQVPQIRVQVGFFKHPELRERNPGCGLVVKLGVSPDPRDSNLAFESGLTVIDEQALSKPFQKLADEKNQQKQQQDKKASTVRSPY